MAGAGDQLGREEMAVEEPGAASAPPPYPSRALRRARTSAWERPGAGRGPGPGLGWCCGAEAALAGEARAEAAAGCLARSLGARSVWGSGGGCLGAGSSAGYS